MAVKKTAASKKAASQKKSSSGSDPKSKKTVQKKMQRTMHEFKQHDLESGRSGKQVKNPKQAISIGLNEARKSGAKIPPNPNQKKSATKKTTSKKAAAKKAPAKKAASKKTAAKKS